MGMSVENRYRILVGVIIAAAAIMLILGQTLLKKYLGGWSYLIYWLISFSLTCLAFFFACIDILRLRQRARKQQRKLIEDAIAKLPDLGEDTASRKTR